LSQTSSVAGKYGAPLRTGYSAAKHALHGYFDSLRLELAPFKVSVSMIVLGAVKTDISKSLLREDPDRFHAMLTEITMKQFLNKQH
jgi:NAD(P)-dependent dehydrogenase (short-subunit alcohol dehydrogenase family)